MSEPEKSVNMNTKKNLQTFKYEPNNYCFVGRITNTRICTYSNKKVGKCSVTNSNQI